MNRELFDNAKALVESRMIEAVEVALQTVYGLGTDAQKAEIEEMAVVLMMVNRDKGCIKWAKSRLESTQFVNSTVVIHSIASLLLKTSQQSLMVKHCLPVKHFLKIRFVERGRTTAYLPKNRVSGH